MKYLPTEVSFYNLTKYLLTMMRLVATVSALLLLNSDVSAQSDSGEQVNLALNRGAFTSQSSDGWPAAYAVDGRPSEDLKSVPDPGIPSCSHTAVAGDVDAWWKVELSQEYYVHTVLAMEV